MNIKGKKFVDSNGKVGVVRDFFDNVTIFEDGSKVDTRILLDSKFYTELPSGNIQKSQTNSLYATQPAANPFRTDVVDPNSFLNQRNVLLEQMNKNISSIPNEFIDKLPIDQTGRVTPYADNSFYPIDNTSAAYTVNPDVEAEIQAAELARKYQHLGDISSANNQAIKQANAFKSNEKIAKMLEEEGVDVQAIPPVPQEVQRPIQPIRNTIVQEQQPQYTEENRATSRQIEPVMGNNYNNPNAYMDPMIAVFKRSKMNTDFKFSIEIDKKIPKLAYIEMMEESCETSIIEYLAQEFTESILRNPEFIKNKIAEEIRNMIEQPRVKKTKKIVEKKIPEIKEEVKLKPLAKSKLTPKTKAPVSDIIDNKDNKETEVVKNKQ